MYTNKCQGSFINFIVQSLTILDNITTCLYVQIDSCYM